MKNILMLALVAGVLLSSACKKKVEEQYQDVITKMMVDGSWQVTSFTEDGVNTTGFFDGWVCKFYDNKSMTATDTKVTPNVVKNGSWNSDINAYTFTASFPASVGEPLSKLTGTWNITSVLSSSKGRFSQLKNGVAYTMELTKI